MRGVVDTIASIAVAAGGGYFLFRGLAFAKRRLLWRVRRKLIISYIFIGFIPAILIVAFFLLGGLLLFFNFSSYLVQSRLRALSDRAHALAVTTALEMQRPGARDVRSILAERYEAAEREFPGAGVSLAVVPMDRPCASTSATGASASPPTARTGETAGRWAHVDPPVSVPGWIDCGGFSGLLVYTTNSGLGTTAASAPTIVIDGRRIPPSAETHLLVRAVAFPESAAPEYAVVVDLPMSEEVRQQLRRDTGVELASFRVVTRGGGVAAGAGRGAGRRAGSSGSPADLGQHSRVPRLDDRSGRPARRDHAAEHRRDLSEDLRLAGADREPQLRRGPSAGADCHRRAVSHHRSRRAGHRPLAGAVDHRIGARAVRRDRAGPSGRLHAQDCGESERSARRAGAVVQLDDGQHRGSAPPGG